ncbi:MAG: glycosyltransferase family 2 protein [Nitrosomonas sp.]|nr:MAG: glycosyltransferase family 2 protein [Nitrosomonas sp.]
MITDQDYRPPVSVIIINYNAGDLLIECVAAALKQTRQIIVVDNASSDSSLQTLETQFGGTDALTIIRSDHNIGFAAGCNRGIAASTQPYLLFLNPDCILSSGALLHMVAAMESSPRIGMAGGYLANPDGTEQGGGRRAIPTPWRAFVRAFGLYRLEKLWPRLFFDFHLHRQPLPPKPIEVEAVSGALMLVRREAINDVGTWDEGYFLHCEDLDWCIRFRQRGWKIIFVPDAPATHFKGVCSHTRPFFVAWHKHRGMLRFYRKFFRRQYPGVMMGIITVAVWLRFCVAVLGHILRSGYRILKPKHE